MFFRLKIWSYCPVWSAVIRAMPGGNVGIDDGTDISFSDGLVRYGNVKLADAADRMWR